MPISSTTPGIYREENPGEIRLITGVATSISAFIGRTIRGPVHEPVSLFSYSDYQRVFGELGSDYPLSYSVRDFFRNGGTHAIVARLYKKGNTDGCAKIVRGALRLQARHPGTWGNHLRLEVQRAIPGYHAGRRRNNTFSLIIRDISSGAQEIIEHVGFLDNDRRIDRVLHAESTLICADEDIDYRRRHLSATRVPRPFTGGVDSLPLTVLDYAGSVEHNTGIYALETANIFNLLCIPPDKREGETHPSVYRQAMEYCEKRRAMLLIDAPSGWKSASDILNDRNYQSISSETTAGSGRNAALYFPRVKANDPLRNNKTDTYVPSGSIAGMIARTDLQRGVWKAPAGMEAVLHGAQELSVQVSDADNNLLNPLGVNCLRSFQGSGIVVWGSRTLRGADGLSDEYKYIPVRRLALYIEESIHRGTQWAVFEPNGEPLWSRIRQSVGTFLHDLFREGAFQGMTPSQAYFVKCGADTNTAADINAGMVNIQVGFAPLKPAEFVIITIRQAAGQSSA